MKRIIPSVASANQLFLAEEIGAFPAGTLLHVDIEDGNFVNNITFGMRTVRSIANMFPQHPLCFHFMATNPSQYFEEIAKCGARQVAVHFEGLPYPSEELCRIRELGMIPGLAINLRTSISQVEPFFEYIDFLMVMTMDSGYGGTNGLGFCFANHDRIRQARAALPAGKELWVDGAMGETQVGSQARLMSQALRKLTSSISKTKTVCIFINQLRDKIGVVYGNPETTTGGNALKFYASVRIDIRRMSVIKDGEDQLGTRTKVKVVKNKVAPPFKRAEFDIMFGEGISKIGEIVDLGVDYGVVKKAGSWFSYGDRKIGQGRDAVKELLKNDEELRNEIEAKVREAMKTTKKE